MQDRTSAKIPIRAAGLVSAVAIIGALAYGLYFRDGRAPDTEPSSAAPRSAAVGVATGVGADRNEQPASRPATRSAARWADRPRPNPKKPRIHICLFLIDTLRADRVGAYGYDRFPTSPAIDSLAAEGVLFEQAYAPAPWTLPSVVSLMTSTWPCEHGALSGKTMMPAELVPLAERLRGIGYTAMALVGNEYAGKNYGLGRGFDGYADSSQNNAQTLTDALVELKLRAPTFMYIHNTEPHNPYHYAPPHTAGFPDVDQTKRDPMEAAYKSYRSLTRVDFRNGSSLGETDNTAQQQAALARLTELGEDWSDLYDASVRLSDRYLGSVVDMIRASPMWDQTLFILVADHGEEFNEHGGWVHDQSVYEELLRVPLIIKFPNSDWAGRRVAAPVSLLDIVPTLAEYLGEPSIATNARGRSLIPLIEGGAPADPDEFFIAGIRHNVTKYYRPWKESRGDINIALRHDQYKAIWNVEPDTLELYDLQADPGERTNLAEQNRQLAAQLRAAAQRWYEQCASTGAGEPGRAPDPMSAEALERLRGLGYVD